MQRLPLAALTALVIAAPAFAAPLGNGFTYQGELKSSGSPVSVATDFQFSLWDGPGAGCPPAGGAQLGATQTVSNQTVTDGRFTVILNAAGEFGLNAFDGNARWLQIAVRSPAGVGAFTTLCPRQSITATPYALKIPGIDGHSLDAADGSPLDALFVDGSGNVGIGTTAPTSLLHVNGTARMNGIQMPTGAGAGKLLTSDVSGNATWQAGSGGLTLPYVGSVNSPGQSAFQVQNTASGGTVHGLAGKTSSTDPDASGVFGEAVAGSGFMSGVHGKALNSQNGTGVYGEGMVGVWGRSPDFEGLPRGAGPGYAAVYGESGESGNGVVGDAGPYGYGVQGRCSDIGTGVYGIAGTLGWGVYGIAGSLGKGVYGRAGASGYGVYGDGGTLDHGIGIYGIASGTPGYHTYAVYGENPGNSFDTWAGYFPGRVWAYNLYTASAASKIDHPLDPENQYLNHAFVESPDMKNIYDGNAVLDAHGEAVVEMPEWFEALNGDFRYQLTAIGAPAPGLHVAQEISNRSFRIAGGLPGLKVSWQLTGIRRDATANANRIRVEEPKSQQDRGRYMDPKAFGLPEERSVDYERRMKARPPDPLARGATPKR